MLLLRGHEGPVRCLAYSPDGSEMASGGDDGFLRIWDVIRGEERLALREKNHEIQGLAYGPDGRSLASGGKDGAVLLRDSADGRTIKRHERTEFRRNFHDYPVNGLVFAPGGRFLISVGGTVYSESSGGHQVGETVIWDTDTERFLVLRGAGAGAVWSVACDAAGESMAFGTGTNLLVTPGLRGEAFRAWTKGVDLYLQQDVIHMNFRECSRFHRKCPGRIRALAFAPDGQTLASAWGRSVALWDPTDGRLRANFSGHEDEVSGLTFASDGRTVASSSIDGTVRFWDADSGRPTACYLWDIGFVHCVAFAPDGMTIAAGGDSGIVVWDVDEPS